MKVKHEDYLKGFHMVAAISQNTIDYQFSQLFKQQIIHNQLDITMADTGIELKAQLSAPTVSFSLPDNHYSVLFMLNMPSGQFSYYEGFGKNAQKHTIVFKDWVYAFKVGLNMLQIKQNDLKKGGKVPQEVINHLEHFEESMFTIRHLFMDFENANFADYDSAFTRMKFPDNSNISPGQLTQFQQGIQNYFKSLIGKENPYILGYSAESNKNNIQNSTLTPTGATFSTYVDDKNEGLNALNFLVMTNHGLIPSNPNAGLLASNWIVNNDYDGRFVIGSHLFWNQWLLPKISREFDMEISPSDTGWSLTHTFENNHTEKDAVRCISDLTKVDAHIKETENYTANVSFENISAEKIEIDISGTFIKTYRNDFTCILPEWMSEKATLDWNGKITISTGNDGKLSLDLELKVPDAKKEMDGNLLGKGDIGLIPTNKENLDGIGNSFKANMQSSLNDFKSLINDLNSQFILPAGNVFFFKNAQMDDYGNILLDISYKSEH